MRAVESCQRDVPEAALPRNDGGLLLMLRVIRV